MLVKLYPLPLFSYPAHYANSPAILRLYALMMKQKTSIMIHKHKICEFIIYQQTGKYYMICMTPTTLSRYQHQ